MTLIERIQHEMLSDDSDDSERLLALYRGASEAERRALDAALICLCGWSLKTLLEDMGAQ